MYIINKKIFLSQKKFSYSQQGHHYWFTGISFTAPLAMSRNLVGFIGIPLLEIDNVSALDLCTVY